ncbi:hypothetical protein NVP1121O_088 [Vibrio phage 1.121.O._10N.286.46.C4]|nr:hypothetical protein NVP1121O_088 [Vibrio phage 1.121.O._10N.286.46.C4]
MWQEKDVGEYFSYDYECPHCETRYEAYGDHECDEGDHTCEVCNKDFQIEVEYVPSYIVIKS